jgi:hypothetical protein
VQVLAEENIVAEVYADVLSDIQINNLMMVKTSSNLIIDEKNPSTCGNK